jgi:hypothetical protein
MKMFKIYLQTDIAQWDHEEVPKAEQHMTVDLAWLSPQCAKLCVTMHDWATLEGMNRM